MKMMTHKESECIDDCEIQDDFSNYMNDRNNIGEIPDDIMQSFPLSNLFYRGEEAEGFDISSGDKWIYPTNYPVRDYQFNIVKTALYENTLVCLPTGLGKTFIAAVVMYNYYRWYPKGKIIFMAPTRPLTNQQIEACQKIMGISDAHMEEFTGKLKPEVRKEKWMKNRIFFATPQVIANDIKNKCYNPHEIKLIVIDEAHKAQGNFAYCQVVQSVFRYNKKFRLLALSATPGSTSVAVQQVIRNLLISRVIVKDEESADVKPYVHKREISTVIVPLSNDIKKLKNRFFKVIERYMNNLRNQRIVCGNLSSIAKFKLILMQEEFTKTKAKQLPPAVAGQIQQDFAALITLYSALELLVKHGVHSFLTKLEELITLGSSCFKIRLAKDQALVQLVQDIKSELGARELGVQDPNISLSTIETSGLLRESLLLTHPKMVKLDQIVVKHFEDCREKNIHTRAIVFVENRNATNQICSVLHFHYPLVKPMIFIGQLREGSGGYTQKKQLEVIKKFRNGTYNTLISTCVGEEGLDIGEVDLIICYDSNASIVRLKQRIGRTGRQRVGRVVVLVTEGTESNKLKNCLYRTGTMSTTLLNQQTLQPYLYKESPRMIPNGMQPECLRMNLAVTPEPGNNQDMRKFLKPKRRSKGKSETAAGNLLNDADLPNFDRFPEPKYLFSMTKEELHYEFTQHQPGELYEVVDLCRNVSDQRRLQESCLIEHSSDTEHLVSLMRYAEAKRSKQLPTTQVAAFASQVAASEICSKKRKAGSGKWIRKRKAAVPKCKFCDGCDDCNGGISKTNKHPSSSSMNIESVIDDVVESVGTSEIEKQPVSSMVPLQKETETDKLLNDVLEKALEQYDKVHDNIRQRNKIATKPIKINIPKTLVEVLKNRNHVKEEKVDLSFKSSFDPEQLKFLDKLKLKLCLDNINSDNYFKKNSTSLCGINIVRKDERNNKSNILANDFSNLMTEEMPNFELNVFLPSDDIIDGDQLKSHSDVEKPANYMHDSSNNNKSALRATNTDVNDDARTVSENVTFDLGFEDFFEDTVTEINHSTEQKPINDKNINFNQTSNPLCFETPVDDEEVSSQRSDASDLKLNYPDSPVLGTQISSTNTRTNVSLTSSTPKRSVRKIIRNVPESDIDFSNELLFEELDFDNTFLETLEKSENYNSNNSDLKSLNKNNSDAKTSNLHGNNICEENLRHSPINNVIAEPRTNDSIGEDKNSRKHCMARLFGEQKHNILTKNSESSPFTNAKAILNKSGYEEENSKSFKNQSNFNCRAEENSDNKGLVSLRHDKGNRVRQCLLGNGGAEDVEHEKSFNDFSSSINEECGYKSDMDIFADDDDDFEANTALLNIKSVEVSEKKGLIESKENIFHLLETPGQNKNQDVLEKSISPIKRKYDAISKTFNSESVKESSTFKLPVCPKQCNFEEDDGDDDFIAFAVDRRRNNRKVFNISDHSLTGAALTSSDDDDDKDGMVQKNRCKANERKKNRKHEFIEDEADVSVDCKVSSDENSEGLDEFEDSFVDDDTLNHQNTQLQQKYLHSVIRESDAPIHYKKPSGRIVDVYSQPPDDDTEDSYEEDSFCVKSSNESSSSEMSELEIVEEKLMKKRSRKLNCGSKRKRRRIITLSSDDSVNEESEGEYEMKQQRNVEVFQCLKDESTMLNVCEKSAKISSVDDGSDDDFEMCYIKKPHTTVHAVDEKKSANSLHKNILNQNIDDSDRKSVKERCYIDMDFSNLDVCDEDEVDITSHDLNVNRPQFAVLISNEQMKSALSVIKKLKEEFKAVLQFANLGEVDYAISYRTGIVRMLSNESLIQEHILSQRKVSILKSTFLRPVVIIESNCSKVNVGNTDVKPFQLSNEAANAISFESNLKVLFSRNQDETATIISSIASSEVTSGYDLLRTLDVMDTKSTLKSFVSQLPGVNFTLALHLCHKYKTVFDLCERLKTLKDIQKELEISPDNAAHLHKILNNIVQA